MYNRMAALIFLVTTISCVFSSGTMESLRSYVNKYVSNKPAPVQSCLANVTVVVGDITQQHGIETIVNAANPEIQFRGMAGVTKAIADVLGSDLSKLEQTLAQNPTFLAQGKRLSAGDALKTESFSAALKKGGIRSIVHAVAPDLRGVHGIRQPTELDKTNLKNAYTKSIKLALEDGSTIAFPLLGAGVYGWDKKIAMELAAQAIITLDPTIKKQIKEIRFVIWQDPRNPQQAQADAQLFCALLRDAEKLIK